MTARAAKIQRSRARVTASAWSMFASGWKRASERRPASFRARPSPATLPRFRSPWCNMAEEGVAPLRTLIVDDEPLAVERMQVICAALPSLSVVGTASDGAAALRLVEALSPDLLLL